MAEDATETGSGHVFLQLAVRVTNQAGPAKCSVPPSHVTVLSKSPKGLFISSKEKCAISDSERISL